MNGVDMDMGDHYTRHARERVEKHRARLTVPSRPTEANATLHELRRRTS